MSNILYKNIDTGIIICIRVTSEIAKLNKNNDYPIIVSKSKCVGRKLRFHLMRPNPIKQNQHITIMNAFAAIGWRVKLICTNKYKFYSILDKKVKFQFFLKYGD